MAFNLVRSGDNFAPSAAFHNATLRMLNNRGRIGGGVFKGGSGGGGAYSGPFAMTWNNGSVDVDYGCIIAGAELINTNRNNFYDTSPYWIILTLSRNAAGTGYTYAYSRTASGGYPAQTATEYKVTIGYVNPASQTLVQWQHGPIYVAGRVV